MEDTHAKSEKKLPTLPKCFTVSFVVLLNVLTVSMLAYQFAFLNISRPVLINFMAWGKDGPSDGKKPNFSPTQLKSMFGLYVCIYNVFQVAGCLASVAMANILGRKMTLLVIQSAAVVLGSLLQGIAYYIPGVGAYAVLVIGRSISGFGGGIAFSVVPLYVMECSPPRWRGQFGSFMSMFMGLGQVIGAVFSLTEVMGTAQLWPILLTMPGFLSIIQLAISYFMPESPKFLYNQKNDPVASEKVVEKFYHSRANYQAVMNSFEKEHELALKFGKIALGDIFKRRELRNGLLIAVVCAVSQAFSGGITLISYSGLVISSVFKNQSNPEQPLDPQQKLAVDMGVVGLAILSFICRSFMGLVLIQKFGRRTLNVYMLIGCMIAMLVIFALGLAQYASTFNAGLGYGTIVMIALHSVCFCFGPGAIGLFIGTELTPFTTRTQVTAIAAAANGLAIVILSLLFPILNDAVGAWTYLILFLGPCSLLIVYLYIMQPETSGKSVEEILALWRDPSDPHDAHGMDHALTTARETSQEDPLFLKKKTSVIANPLTEFMCPISPELWLYNVVEHHDDADDMCDVADFFTRDTMPMEAVIQPNSDIRKRPGQTESVIQDETTDDKNNNMDNKAYDKNE